MSGTSSRRHPPGPHNEVCSLLGSVLGYRCFVENTIYSRWNFIILGQGGGRVVIRGWRLVLFVVIVILVHRQQQSSSNSCYSCHEECCIMRLR